MAELSVEGSSVESWGMRWRGLGSEYLNVDGKGDKGGIR